MENQNPAQTGSPLTPTLPPSNPSGNLPKSDYKISPITPKRIIFAFLLAIGIILISLTIYYFVTRPPKKEINLKPIPTPTINNTTGWKKFESSFGYSFKYPNDMEIYSVSSIVDKYEIQIKNEKYFISVKKPKNYNKPLDNVLDEQIKSFNQESVKTTKSLTVGGYPAMRKEGDLKLTPPKTIFQILEAISLPNQTILIIEAHSLNNLPENLEKTLDQILSTFKFTKQ